MDDMIIYMFKKLFEFDTSDATGIKQTLSEYSNDTYNVVTSLHNTGIKPVASVVISMLLVSWQEMPAESKRINSSASKSLRLQCSSRYSLCGLPRTP